MTIQPISLSQFQGYTNSSYDTPLEVLRREADYTVSKEYSWEHFGQSLVTSEEAAQFFRDNDLDGDLTTLSETEQKRVLTRVLNRHEAASRAGLAASETAVHELTKDVGVVKTEEQQLADDVAAYQERVRRSALSEYERENEVRPREKSEQEIYDEAVKGSGQFWSNLAVANKIRALLEQFQ